MRQGTLSYSEVAAICDESVGWVKAHAALDPTRVFRLGVGAPPRVGWRTPVLWVGERSESGRAAVRDRLDLVRLGVATVDPDSDPEQPTLAIDQPAAERRRLHELRDDEVISVVRDLVVDAAGGGYISRVEADLMLAPTGLSARDFCGRLGLRWAAILRLTGAPRVPHEPVQRDEYVQHLQDAHVDVGRPSLSMRAFEAWAVREGLAVTAADVAYEFGSWTAAKEAAGIPARVPPLKHRFTDEELLELLRAAASASAEGLTVDEFDRYTSAAGLGRLGSMVVHRFQTWRLAKRAAGLTSDAAPQPPAIQLDARTDSQTHNGRRRAGAGSTQDGVTRTPADPDRYSPHGVSVHGPAAPTFEP